MNNEEISDNYNRREFLSNTKEQDQAFLKLFCTTSLFTRLIERDKAPKTGLERQEMELFRGMLRDKNYSKLNK